MHTALTHGALCNGIAGFPLAARQAGIITTWTVEKDPFCNAVSRRHFPHAHQFLDIYDARQLPPVDIISAGYPCQPESYAGKRRGTADDRWLWPEVLRILTECQPGWFLGENVAGHVTLGLEGVLSDLEATGYEVWPLVLPACALGAPHRRDRVWIIAHAHHRQPARPPQALCAGRDAAGPGREAAPDSDSQRCGQPDGQSLAPGQSQGSRPDGCAHPAAGGWRITQPALCARNDGVSVGLVRPDGGRNETGAEGFAGRQQADPRHWARNTLRAAGNALVPQIPALFFQFIADYEAGRHQQPPHPA